MCSITSSAVTGNPSDCVLFLRIPCRVENSLFHTHQAPGPTRYDARLLRLLRRLRRECAMDVGHFGKGLRYGLDLSRVSRGWIVWSPRNYREIEENNPGAQIGHRRGLS